MLYTVSTAWFQYKGHPLRLAPCIGQAGQANIFRNETVIRSHDSHMSGFRAGYLSSKDNLEKLHFGVGEGADDDGTVRGGFYPLFHGISRSRPPGSRPSCATQTHAIP